jgi:hypothetical protein
VYKGTTKTEVHKNRKPKTAKNSTSSAPLAPLTPISKQIAFTKSNALTLRPFNNYTNDKIKSKSTITPQTTCAAHISAAILLLARNNDGFNLCVWMCFWGDRERRADPGNKGDES